MVSMIPIIFLSLDFLVVFTLAFLIYSEKPISKAYLVLLGISPLVLAYIYNPALRIYSVHGYMHASIVYQILNGNIPPMNPLFGATPLGYHWGYHYVAALVSTIFNVSPFYSFAAINIVSLFFSILLVYRISALFIKDEKANILSVLVSIYAISIQGVISKILSVYAAFPGGWLFKTSMENRAVPVFQKFYFSNGVPVGIVFYLLFLYSVIMIFRRGNRAAYYILLFISILAGGFLYPGFLAGIIPSIAIISFGGFFFLRKQGGARRAVLILLSTASGIILLSPYLLPLLLQQNTLLEIFNWPHVYLNAKRLLFVSLPILCVIFLNLDFFKKKDIDKNVLRILLAVMAVSGILYLSMRLPLGNEYKLLILASVCLGIPGGAAFSAARGRYGKTATFAVLMLFILPLLWEILYKPTKFGKGVLNCKEKGRNVLYKNPAYEELYSWIRNNTPKDAVFIDSTLDVPVFGQRQLFTVFLHGQSDMPAPIGYSSGFHSMVEIADGLTVSGYSRVQRNAAVEDIYSRNSKTLSEDTLLFLNKNRGTYIIIRQPDLAGKFNGEIFREVFRSSDGLFSVYQIRPE